MLLHHTASTTAEDLDTPEVQRVRAAIAQLPPAERDLLVLRFGEDLDTATLAARLSTSTEVVQDRLHRAGWQVQDQVGPVAVTPMPSDPTGSSPLRTRPANVVEEEAAAGITPLLAARIVAAVADGPPPADEHWRARALVRQLRSHFDAVLLVLLVATIAAPAAVTLSSL